MGALHASVSTLPPLEPANTHSLPPGPGKREWEIGKAGFLNWANAQLVQHAKKATGSTLENASAEDRCGVTSNEDLTAALHDLEHES